MSEEKKGCGCGGLLFFAVAVLFLAMYITAQNEVDDVRANNTEEKTDNPGTTELKKQKSASVSTDPKPAPTPPERQTQEREAAPAQGSAPAKPPLSLKPNRLTFAEIAYDRSLWPEVAAMTEPHTIPIVLDGEEIGHQTFEKGQTAKPVRDQVEARMLYVEINGNRLSVPVDKTDFIESANLISIAKGNVALAAKRREKQQAADERKQARERAAEIENRKKLAREQFSSWDGSHFELKKLLENRLKDPGSLEIVDTR